MTLLQEKVETAPIESAGTSRPGIAVLPALAGALTAALAAVQPWWRLIETPEPHLVLGFRAACLAAAVLAVAGAAVRKRRVSLWLAAAFTTLSASFLFVWMIVAASPRDMSDAIFQYKQMQRISRVLRQSDVNLEAQWNPQRNGSSSLMAKNDTTVTDDVEIALYFVKGGWYLCALSVFLLGLSAFSEDSRVAAALARRRALPAALFLAVPVAVWGVCCAIGHRQVDEYQIAMAQGKYPQALAKLQNAAKWDPRLNYDTIYHYELGRAYGAMHDTQHADYWAMLGDTMLQNDLSDNAVMLYRIGANIKPLPPVFNERFGTALERNAFSDELAGRYAGCVAKGLEAQRYTPHNPEIVYSLAIQATNQGDFSNAIGLWKRLIDQIDSVGLFRSKFFASYTYTKPIVARSWSALAYCFYKLGEYDKSMACVKASRDLKQTKTDWVAP
jgi:tetratricopeptide (TPR) repeat protein